METVVITGATSGIGLSTTRLFLNKGWGVMMASNQREQGEKLCAKFAEQFGNDRVAFTCTDVSDAASVAALHDATFTKFSSVTSLVNDAEL
ncbi:MAG: SDR family NAD(P)-dependent oxidoreductase [Limosilactobacillus pontis]